MQNVPKTPPIIAARLGVLSAERTFSGLYRIVPPCAVARMVSLGGTQNNSSCFFTVTMVFRPVCRRSIMQKTCGVSTCESYCTKRAPRTSSNTRDSFSCFDHDALTAPLKSVMFKLFSSE
ncbi:hypothetical protein BaRGS_00033511 [Batillaria attramentaria]|uniref:Uncharacterized protein n=1 Tax=Batillaria attramentaria TaxID=370345 RepID=A0ABD0JJZ9_9CAEN